MEPLDADWPTELEPAHPPMVDEAGRLRLSFSRIDTYRTCPRKFRYAYIDRLPGKPSPHLSFGSSVHTALERFYDQKLPLMPDEDALMTALYEGWDPSGFTDMEREEQLAYYRHAQQVLHRFRQRVGDDYRLPVATEAWFEMPVDDDVLIVGSIDRVDRDDDGALHVVDYKTNRKAQDRQRVAKSLQLAIYAMACEHLYGQYPASVALDFVVPGVVVRVDVSDIDLQAAVDTIRDVAHNIRAERFEPTPMRLCDWCDFRPVCPAWTASDDAPLGELVEHVATLRRDIRRQVHELRAVEAGIDRLQQEFTTGAAAGQVPSDDDSDAR